ncbi:hypothetical protein MRX96_034824 [Rhipicephalus microplus]
MRLACVPGRNELVAKPGCHAPAVYADDPTKTSRPEAKKNKKERDNKEARVFFVRCRQHDFQTAGVIRSAYELFAPRAHYGGVRRARGPRMASMQGPLCEAQRGYANTSPRLISVDGAGSQSL